MRDGTDGFAAREWVPSCIQPDKNVNEFHAMPERIVFFPHLVFLCVLILWTSDASLRAQQLNLPPRPADAPTGSEFKEQVRNLTLAAREEAIYEQVMAGNVPAFLRDLIPVTVSGSSGNETLEVTYYVTPDYLAVGRDDDYFLIPTTPILAQRIGNEIGCGMPTRRMVDQIWQAAPLKLAPRTIPPSGQMTTIPVMYEHHLMVWEQRESALDEHPPGTLVGGHKKDVVVSNRIYNQPPPGRVVIYGWHYLNGTPIQPLYSGHAETYADYSHGIRLVRDSIMVNGEPGHIRDLLQHPERHALLSDEGQIALPYYPTGDLFEVPDEWGVIGEDASGLRLVLGDAPAVTEYLVHLSGDGRNFQPPIRMSPDDPVVAGLTSNSLVYLRLQAVADQPGPFSEVLAGVPSEKKSPVLIVNGFDRPISGNTRDFIRHYAPELQHHGYQFDAATNEAVGSGLVDLNNYEMVFWILGAESTADRTFDEDERLRVGNYLHGGGALFVSGSEIAWDLGLQGSTADQQFLRNFLKTEYLADAPDNQSNSFYQAEGVSGTLFGGLADIRFDNGTQGTWNVSWPDVLRPVEGGAAVLRYTGVSEENVAGVAYRGLFPRAERAGAVVVLGFPFETIYLAETRVELMGRILDFLGDPEGTDTGNDDHIGDGFGPGDPGRPGEYQLHQNYPNPFNNSTVIAYHLPESAEVRLAVFSLEGRTVTELFRGFQPAGRHTVAWDASGLASGVYIYKLSTGPITLRRAMTLLK